MPVKDTSPIQSRSALAIDRKEAQHYLNSFSFQQFFTELMGWNATPASQTVKTLGQEQFHFTTVAEKKGYTVLVCDGIPSYPIRAKLDRLIARDHREHIIIFSDAHAKLQIWQVSLRDIGQPVKLREVSFRAGTSGGEELIQKLQQIAVPLAFEESTHLADLTLAARAAFNRDKVTKSFYKQFELEHKAFLKFLKGVPETTRAWYVSVLINRLMFLYFMQSKSFLDGNTSYLTDQLKASSARKKDAFYREFLCPLFFNGFALKKEARTPEVKAMLGDIPYLNGGLFQKHAIELQAETDGSPITVSDRAFQQLFAFFDKWTWHLDASENATGDEIDPDVLGYIFEKYINQKQMGAYYTKEDITGYIAQNTVIPFLFDTARKGCANAFQHDGAVWRLLRDDPNRYIYPAMRRGNEALRGGEPAASGGRLVIPDDIAAGLANVKLRTGWNIPVPEHFNWAALPTETWREFIARRRRYDDLLARISSGEVHEVNDLITFNLDIRQLALDAVQIAGSEDLVESFYKAIESVTILDPTCGSGAFLFAALELLQPLYQACLIRMQEFVDEAEAEAARKGKPLHFNRFKHFRNTLAAAGKHVNIDYFILKTIIVQNLYGVDIMEEATEICKLRLFLKLVGRLDAKNKNKIEPLPDIDFNIRAGNTLVGYARYDDVKKATEGDLLDGEAALVRIKDRLQTLDAAAAQFRRQQTELNGSVTARDKQELSKKYKHLEDELDDYLSAEYGLKRNAVPLWKANTKPFHWFCDFHAIISNGGFDVIIGNPPYVEYSKVRDSYRLLPEYAEYLGNLYAACAYRCELLNHPEGYHALIVPASLPSTDRMQVLRNLLERANVHQVSFSTRPQKLFDGAEQRLTIYLQSPSKNPGLYTGGYLKWSQAERPQLFQTLSYVDASDLITRNAIWPKVNTAIELQIMQKVFSIQSTIGLASSGNDGELFYKNTGLRYFNTVTLRAPKCWINGVATASSRETKLSIAQSWRHAVHATLISSTFFLIYQALTNCRDLNPSDITTFPIPLTLRDEPEMSRLSQVVEADYIGKAKLLKMNNKLTGEVVLESLSPARSKPIIDEIDGVLAKHYGFSDEELDFIINYDVKYRMGSDGAPDADD